MEFLATVPQFTRANQVVDIELSAYPGIIVQQNATYAELVWSQEDGFVPGYSASSIDIHGDDTCTLHLVRSTNYPKDVVLFWEEVSTLGGSTALPDGVLVSELGTYAITALNDGAVRFCTGGVAENDGLGGLFYAKFGDASAAAAGENVVATGGRWKRVGSNRKHAMLYDLLIGTRKGAYDREELTTAGYYYIFNPTTAVQGAGDGGCVRVRWDATSTRPADGVRVFGDATVGAGALYRNPATGVLNATYYPDPVGGAVLPNYPVTAGRWIVVEDSKYIGFKQCGAIANGYPSTTAPFISDHNAVHNMVLACFAYGAEIDFSAGTIGLADTLKIKGNNVGSAGQANLHFRGGNIGGQTFNSTVIRWYGPSDRPMMSVSNLDSLYAGIQFDVGVSYHAACGINIGWHPGDFAGGTAPVITHQKIANCSFVGKSATIGAGSMEWGIVFDFYEIQAANIENCSIVDCTFASVRNGGVLIKYNCQPYNTVVERCYYISTLHSVSDRPYGTFIRNECASASIQVMHCDVQRCALHFDLVQPFQSFVCIGQSSEQSKKLVWGLFGTTQTQSSMIFIGGRHDMGGLDVASEGPGNATFTAPDVRWGWVGGTMLIKLMGMRMTRAFVTTAFEWGYSSGVVDAECCVFPNLEPFVACNDYDVTHIQGGVWSRCNTAPGTGGHAGTQQSMPLLQGTRCPGGTFTVVGGSTTQAVTFYKLDGVTALPEGVGANGWRARFTVLGFTGSPAGIGSVYAASKTNAGFAATFVDPGGTATITYGYELYRSHL